MDIQLVDGGLYETKHGKRFRVKQSSLGFFHCRSFSGHWDANGRAIGKVFIDGNYRKPHLVRRVNEMRAIPLSQEEYSAGKFNDICEVGGHLFRLVTRDEARKIGQLGHEKHLKNNTVPKSDALFATRVVSRVQLREWQTATQSMMTNLRILEQQLAKVLERT